jgi:hypothetical protein
MGDWTELALDGVLCQHCGTYLGGACGYPRSCRGCDWQDEKTKEGPGSSYRDDQPPDEEDEDLPFWLEDWSRGSCSGDAECGITRACT